MRRPAPPCRTRPPRRTAAARRPRRSVEPFRERILVPVLGPFLDRFLDRCLSRFLADRCGRLRDAFGRGLLRECGRGFLHRRFGDGQRFRGRLLRGLRPGGLWFHRLGLRRDRCIQRLDEASKHLHRRAGRCGSQRGLARACGCGFLRLSCGEVRRHAGNGRHLIGLCGRCGSRRFRRGRCFQDRCFARGPAQVARPAPWTSGSCHRRSRASHRPDVRTRRAVPRCRSPAWPRRRQRLWPWRGRSPPPCRRAHCAAAPARAANAVRRAASGRRRRAPGPHPR